MTLYVYRLEVTKWPTDDGKPWDRVYGYPHGNAPDWWDDSGNEEAPQWLLDRLVDQKVLASPEGWRISERARYDSDTDEFIGIVMPKPNRKHYLSASGAHELAKAMRVFGAEVEVRRSEAVRWL